MFLALLMLVAATVPASFAASSEGYRITKPHEYAIKPGTSEWRSMDNVLDRRAACYVPEDELKMMTTEALVKTVLEYPLLIDMYAYNSIEEGIKAVSMYFDGIKVLCERKDALKFLNEFAAKESKRTENTEIHYFYADTLIGHIAGKLFDLNALGEKSAPPIYTPKGTPVPEIITLNGEPSYNILYNLSWSFFNTTAEKEEVLVDIYLDVYPSAVQKTAPSPKYNCHSYAWHNKSAYTNLYWINDPQVYLYDGSYSTSTVGLGRNVTYYNTIEGITHSGIVTRVGSGSAPTRISSKWGKSARFEHNVYDCPYYHYYGYNSVQYWQQNP